MNVSFADPPVDISRIAGTSQSLKRSNPKNATSKSAPKPPKRRKRNEKRSYSDDLDNEVESFSGHLSAQTRDTVLKLRRIKDPFDEDLQMVVDDVFLHLDQQPEEDVNLAESALLLSSVTHVYSSQVKNLYDDVLEIAARLTGKESPKKTRGKKKDGEEQKGEADGDGKPSEEKSSEETSKDNEGNTGEPNSGDSNNNENPNPDAANAEKTNAEQIIGPDGLPIPNENPEGSSEANPGENAVEGENSEGVDKDGAGEGNSEQLQTDIATEIPGPCTRRQSERLKNILSIEKDTERDYTLKKKKYDDDPPDLISCHDEWKEIMETIYSKGDIDFDEILPPTLEVAVGRKKKKLFLNNNDDENIDNCETCQSDSQKEDNNKDGNAIKAIMSCLGGHKYETLDHLSDDVQERFHDLVQEMHKLPFDYGLMQQDMFKAYQQKFLQAVTLLSQNSVLVKRSETDRASTETKEMDVEATLNDSQVSETDQTIQSIAELLNQVRRQASEEYNKGKQSKLDAEVPIGQMIATLKRIICSRYKKWHVRTDGDKAVYKRIKEFEDKVKFILKREAEQGLFDVKKYEMEVMDVTLKESQDADSEEFLCPTSPLALQDGAVSPRPDDAKLWNLSNSRRTSVTGSLDGSIGSMSWIRLFDIFSHMKKIDNSETCRHFYAVLALLSHKNLSVNYDALFSQESAKLITKLLKRQKEGANHDKYPVGAKIMTSRCPDFDRDEVFLAPVFNPENLQLALEQDYLSSSGYQSDSQGSSSTSFSPAHPKTIQDAINEFVVDEGEALSMDNLIKTRKRKQPVMSVQPQ